MTQKTLRILLIALATFSMTACWEKKTEAPANTMEQEMEQPMDAMDQEVSDEEMEEEIPEN